jgi:hypothetical protein
MSGTVKKTTAKLTADRNNGGDSVVSANSTDPSKKKGVMNFGEPV